MPHEDFTHVPHENFTHVPHEDFTHKPHGDFTHVLHEDFTHVPHEDFTHVPSFAHLTHRHLPSPPEGGYNKYFAAYFRELADEATKKNDVWRINVNLEVRSVLFLLVKFMLQDGKNP